jgi:hypothetical protein
MQDEACLVFGRRWIKKFEVEDKSRNRYWIMQVLHQEINI